MPEFEQIVPRPRVPINGGTTTKKYEYLQPAPDIKGIEFIIPWIKDWQYWQSTRLSSQLIISQDSRNWISLKEMFEQYGYGIANNYYSEVMLSIKFSLQKNGLYVVQTDGYISGESGPIYPATGSWEWAIWSIPVWHKEVSPGISIALK